MGNRAQEGSMEEKKETLNIYFVYKGIYDFEYSFNGERYPVPPGIRFEGLIRVKGRLYSTRGGGHGWKAKGIEDYLSNSPYRPRINVLIRGEAHDVTGENIEELNDRLLKLDRYLLVWRSRYVPKKILIICSEIIKDFSFRRKREELFSKIFTDLTLEPIGKQGNLEINQLEDGKSQVSEVLNEALDEISHYIHSYRFYNHYIVSYEFFSMIGLDNKRIIFPTDYLYITSSDHLENPIRLPYNKFYLLTHPLPRSTID
ncbi:MAG: hypothetical protein QXI58_00520 [Candidatus Micrarchaeia archaeon]